VPRSAERATVRPAKSSSTTLAEHRSSWTPTAYQACGSTASSRRGVPPDFCRPTSRTRPSAVSSRTTWVIVAGVSPGRSASSTRLSVPADRTRSSTVARVPVRPGAVRGILVDLQARAPAAVPGVDILTR